MSQWLYDFLDQSNGSSRNFLIENTFFNGNYLSNNHEFDQYLKQFGYTFKNQINELAGYTILQNKKFILAADIGSNPEKIYTKNYQAGA